MHLSAGETFSTCDINDGGCSQICFANSSGIICNCKSGWSLSSDNKHCQGMQTYPLLTDIYIYTIYYDCTVIFTLVISPQMLTNVKGEQTVAMMVTANVVTHRVHIIVHVMQATTSVTTERHVFVSHYVNTLKESLTLFSNCVHVSNALTPEMQLEDINASVNNIIIIIMFVHNK